MIHYKNIAQLAGLSGVSKKDGRHLLPADLGLIEEASIVFDDTIKWVGKTKDLPGEFKKFSHVIELDEFVLTPEIVDAHTHLLFGGNRASEYSRRLNGATYEEIAQAGGGIYSTVQFTTMLSENELFEIGKERIKKIASYGVGTIEIKSGYALTFDGEYILTKVIDRLKKFFAPNIQIINTFMAAHAIPKKYSSGRDYLESVVFPLLEKVAAKNLVDSVDIFHEQNYFSTNDTKKLFERAQGLGLRVKIHADEFNDNGGAELAKQYNALSADHLLCTSKSAIKSLAHSQTVALLLPGTGLFLGKPMALARDFLDSGVKVAMGSDYNPGSCHCDNLLLLASIAAPLYKLNQCELWAAITHNAAHALGRVDQGALIPGLRPRFSLFRAKSLDQITYNWSQNLNVELPIH